MSDIVQKVREALAAKLPGDWRVADGEKRSHFHGPYAILSDLNGVPRVLAELNVHFPYEADAYLIANAPTWLRQMHDEIVRLRGKLALALGEVEGVADEAASFHFIPPTEDDIVSLCAGLQIAKRALSE